jgi:glutathione S-transferase
MRCPPRSRLSKASSRKNQWMLGSDFSLVDCAYCPVLNVVEKAGFSLAEFPRISAYLETLRSRPTWKDTPKLPML